MDSGLLGEKTPQHLPSAGCTPSANTDQRHETGNLITSTSGTKPPAEHPLLSNTWPGSLISHLQENTGGIKVVGVSARKRSGFGCPWFEEGYGIESLLCRSWCKSLSTVTSGCSN